MYSIGFGRKSYRLFVRGLPALLTVCSFCGCLFMLPVFSFGIGLDMGPIVSVPKFTCLFFIMSITFMAIPLVEFIG